MTTSITTDAIRPELSFREHLALITILDLRANDLRKRIAFWRESEPLRFKDFTAFDEEQLREVEALKQKLAQAADPYLCFSVVTTSEEKGA